MVSSMVHYETSPRYIENTFLGFSSDSRKAFATKQTSPRLGDLQLRMDANDGKLKSLSEVGAVGIGDTWVFPKIGVPQNGWFRMENPIKIHDLGVPIFLETPTLKLVCFFPLKKHQIK